MPESYGGHQHIAELADRLPRGMLPDWPDWQLEAIAGTPAPEVIQRTLVHVMTNGWAVVGSDVNNHMYSVGLTQRGWPELVMRLSSGTPRVAMAIFKELVHEATEQKRELRQGQEWCLNAAHVRLAEIPAKWAGGVCAIARELYSEQVRAVEVIPEWKREGPPRPPAI